MLASFLSPFGLLALAALDASIVFFAPAANDVVIVILTVRHRDLFWLFPIMATLGSLLGAATTFWLGRQAGEKGLGRFVSERRLRQVKGMVRSKGAITLAATALAPPPFPLTVLILCSGALDVDKKRFFLTMGVARLVRYVPLSLLALRYGRRIAYWLESQVVRDVGTIFIAVAILGSIYSIYVLVRGSRTGHGAGGET